MPINPLYTNVLDCGALDFYTLDYDSGEACRTYSIRSGPQSGTPSAEVDTRQTVATPITTYTDLFGCLKFGYIGLGYPNIEFCRPSDRPSGTTTQETSTVIQG